MNNIQWVLLVILVLMVVVHYAGIFVFPGWLLSTLVAVGIIILLIIKFRNNKKKEKSETN